VVILGIDAGRCTTVAAGADGYLDKFPSFVGEARALNLENELRPTDIVLATNFGNFFVGDLAKDESMSGARLMTESKVHVDTKALVVAAAARAVKDGEQAAVTTGVPVKLHTPIVKGELQNLLLGEYAVEVNGEAKRFEIAKVNVAVEGPSAYVLLTPNRRGTIRYLDLGSRMISAGTMRDGRKVDKESFSLEFGCDTVAVNNAGLSRLIVSELSQKWPDLKQPTWVFGGGIRRCGNFLAQYLPRMIWAAMPDYVPAQTFYKLGRQEAEMHAG
jgi:plasmid segregation protein ParM